MLSQSNIQDPLSIASAPTASIPTVLPGGEPSGGKGGSGLNGTEVQVHAASTCEGGSSYDELEGQDRPATDNIPEPAHLKEEVHMHMMSLKRMQKTSHTLSLYQLITPVASFPVPHGVLTMWSWSSPHSGVLVRACDASVNHFGNRLAYNVLLPDIHFQLPDIVAITKYGRIVVPMPTVRIQSRNFNICSTRSVESDSSSSEENDSPSSEENDLFSSEDNDLSSTENTVVPTENASPTTVDDLSPTAVNM
ncbi:hypothetical protein D9758_001661 [Tetrapyrgos nigripes]|uniref:Uncharacterized protein n=1 Tax=Tetrapyrgos nigripes TaxID=182062 RepID=A0A8H5GXX7_9AGAR|nr:hypothetical protein D9758_001661 [Tetrapyrgos nigripes]